MMRVGLWTAASMTVWAATWFGTVARSSLMGGMQAPAAAGDLTSWRRWHAAATCLTAVPSMGVSGNLISVWEEGEGEGIVLGDTMDRPRDLRSSHNSTQCSASVPRSMAAEPCDMIPIEFQGSNSSMQFGCSSMQIG